MTNRSVTPPSVLMILTPACPLERARRNPNAANHISGGLTTAQVVSRLTCALAHLPAAQQAAALKCAGF